MENVKTADIIAFPHKANRHPGPTADSHPDELATTLASLAAAQAQQNQATQSLRTALASLTESLRGLRASLAIARANSSD